MRISSIILSSFICLCVAGCDTVQSDSAHANIRLEDYAWTVSSGGAAPDYRSCDAPASEAKLSVFSFPILPNSLFQRPVKNQLESYCLHLTFEAAILRVSGIQVPALYLAGIGEIWSVYLNGQALHLHSAGSQVNYQKNVILPIPPQYLQDTNSLLILLQGHAPATFLSNNFLLGLNKKQGYYIAEYGDIQSQNQQILYWLLVGVYIFFGFYHIFLFLRHPSSHYNGYFGLFSLLLGAYFAVFSNYTFQHFKTTRYLLLWAYVLQPAALQAFLLFLRSYFYNSRLVRALQLALFSNCLIIVFMIALPYRFLQSLLVAWYLIALPQLVYVLYLALRAWWLKLTDARWITLVILILILSVLWDMFDTAVLKSNLRLTQYAFLFFILGMTGVLANRFVMLHHQSELLNKTLHKKNTQLDQAYKQIQSSESKYRHLVESFTDIIFLLDEQLCFVACNHSIHKILQYQPAELIGTHFQDLLYVGTESRSNLAQKIVIANLDELLANKSTVEFTADFRLKHFSEPRELTVQLQYLHNNGRPELLGKAFRQSQNMLLEAFVSEKQHYTLGNYLNHVEQLSHRITRNLVKYVDEMELSKIRITFKEMLVNAIEHGNLGISFAEKTRAQENNSYWELLQSRQIHPDYRDRRVQVVFMVSPRRVLFHIVDQGDGFDHQNLGKSIIRGDTELSHGRGIMMTRSVYDRVRYNQKGNAVTLIKYLGSAAKAK